MKTDFNAICANLADMLPEQPVTSVSARVEREDRLRESGIEFVITSDDFDAIAKGETRIDTHALKTVRRWHASRDELGNSVNGRRAATMFAFVGLTGRGKTVAAAWLLSRLGGAYVTAEKHRRLFTSTRPQDAVELDTLMRKRVVVLDDVGTELNTFDTAAPALYEFINRRNHRSMWTLITANLAKEEFMSRYGERTVRRIEHHGEIMVVTGEDLRRKP